MPVCLCYNNMPFSILPIAPKGCCGQLHFTGTFPIPYTYSHKANNFLSLPNLDFCTYWGFSFPLSIFSLLWSSFFCAFCPQGFFSFYLSSAWVFFSPLLFFLLLLSSVLPFIFPLFFLFCCVLKKFLFWEGFILFLCFQILFYGIFYLFCFVCFVVL